MAYALPVLANHGGFFAAALARLSGVLRRQPAQFRQTDTHASAVRARGNKPAPRQPALQQSPRHQPSRHQPSRLPAADQWAKLSDILGRAAGGAAAAGQLQGAATRQLDLAQYGLTTLVDELSAVMTIPGHKSRTATLHVFGAAGDAPADAGTTPRGSHAMAA